MKFNLKTLPLIAAAAVSLMGAQSASARTFGEIYTDCGLGGMIARETPVLAVITNVTWDWGSTAISSNVSSPDTCEGGKVKTAAYILKSYPQLEQDLARGEGEHLNTLMAVAGCSAVVQPSVVAGLREDLAVRVAAPAYGSASRAEQAEAVFSHLQTAGTCAL